MHYPHLALSTISCLMALSLASVSADDHQHAAPHNTPAAAEQQTEPEQHGAHEHGVATLSLAAGAEGLDIVLDSPAANLLGFEHAPSSAAEQQTLAATQAKLEAGAELFTLNPEAQCSFKSAELVSALFPKAAVEGMPTEHSHADVEHEGTQPKKPDHQESDHKDTKPETTETHHDIEVTWTFTCAQPSALNTVSTQLFSTFPNGFQRLKAEWVTEQGASAQVLDKDATLRLK